MHAKLTAGTLATIETRSLNHGDHICGNEETWYQPLTKTYPRDARLCDREFISAARA